MSQETIDQRFEVDSPAQLKLSNIRGSIDIQPGDDGVIVVTAVKHLNTGNEEKTNVEIEQADDGQVVVKTSYDKFVTNWFGQNKPCKVDYKVQVPTECDVQASGVSSNITTGGLKGTIDLNTVSGKLNLSELSGDLKFNTVSGQIRADKLTGILDSNSVSGKTRVVESELSEATVKTVSGSIHLQTPLTEGPYTFKGVSGSVTLVVPEDTSCSAHFKSVSGRMRTSLPISKDHRFNSRGSMEIQGGGPEVTYKCVSGSFKIVSDENETIVERKETAEPPKQKPDQMAILKKIESGEISVEDAINKMNA
jgi:hypothetical protein